MLYAMTHNSLGYVHFTFFGFRTANCDYRAINICVKLILYIEYMYFK